MSAVHLYACLTLALAPAPEPKSAVIVLLAEEAEYQALKAQELIHEGVLERNPGSGKIGVRFNPYRLAGKDTVDRPVLSELYVPSRAHLLSDHVGQRVRIVGKLRSVEADGKTVRELWPARLEPMSGNRLQAPGLDGVYARCFWQPAAAQQRGGRQYIYRNGEQLAQALGLKGASTEETAAALLAQRLRVPVIDWKKHMLVCISAGLRGGDVDQLVITGARVKDEALTITYRLVPPSKPGPAGFGYPAETVLIDRFEGSVKFVEEKAPAVKE